MNVISGLERITFNPAIMGGRACIWSLRIPVALVLNLVENGMTFPEIIREYPDLESADVEQVVRYAALLANEELLPSAEGMA